MQKEFPWLKPFFRHYLPQDLVFNQWEDVAPYYDELTQRLLNSVEDLKKWLLDFSELESVFAEEATRREVDMTCHTEDEVIKKQHLDFLEHIEPFHKEITFGLYLKYTQCPYRAQLGPDYKELDKSFLIEIELFKSENIPLETEIDILSQRYQEVTGSWMVLFEGREHTMPEMMAYLEHHDALVREKAWKAMTQRRLQDKQVLEDLFSELLEKRQKVAQNLGLPSYREVIFKENDRDYTPEDCYQFHEAVGNALVPLVGQLRSLRRQALGGGALRPWDLACDPKAREPLKPFTQIQELQEGVRQIYQKIDPTWALVFESIKNLQDLESRKGKAPGGYQATFDERRLPFIFSNAAGLQDDVETLLHEAGHAFHALEYRNQPLYWYRGAPMEFCEVASQAQELMGGEHLGVFYKKEELAQRARKKHLESVLELFPWVMTVDAFQHWVYTHKDHSVSERSQAWVDIYENFDCAVNWLDLDPDVKKHFWHKQLHIFLDPFYYIEYAISELGALQIFRNYKKDPLPTLVKFKKAMALGASQSCRALFHEAGIEFRFDEPFVRELAHMIFDEIQK